jgi:hypothetical protein
MGAEVVDIDLWLPLKKTEVGESNLFEISHDALRGRNKTLSRAESLLSEKGLCIG